jgi:hypothetical protein
MKMSTQLAIFFVSFNAIAGIALGMGVAQELGINAETGNPQQLEQATQQTEPDLGSNVGSTLFGMYNQLTSQLGTIFYAIAPGFAMLRNFIPNIWVDALLSPVASLVVSKDLIAFARGTDL